MWAIGAIVAFAIALILNLVGTASGKYVVDAELAGFICLAVALLVPGWGPFRRVP